MFYSSCRLYRIAEYDTTGLILVRIRPEFLNENFEWLDFIEIRQLNELVLQVTQIHVSLLLD